MSLDTTAAEERALIVAWLRASHIETEKDPRNLLSGHAANALADAIERGEHSASTVRLWEWWTPKEPVHRK